MKRWAVWVQIWLTDREYEDCKTLKDLTFLGRNRIPSNMETTKVGVPSRI